MISKYIGVVVVTFNRIEKLKKSLDSYENQEILPQYIVVVDNNSTDGTRNFLNIWMNKSTEYKKKVIFLERNIGGSGGFYEGLKFALDLDAKWIWVSDDDAYLEEHCICKVESILQNLDLEVGAICGQVIENGKINYDHRKYLENQLFNIKFVKSNNLDYSQKKFNIDLYSFVGTALKKNALLEIGLPNKDYFIWFDDTEHSMRMHKRYKILCYPEIKINHDVALDDNTGMSWKHFYGCRNRFFAIRDNYNFFTYKCCLLKFKLGMLLNYLKKDRKKYLIKKRALQAVKQNKLGIDDVYKPGIKI